MSVTSAALRGRLLALCCALASLSHPCAAQTQPQYVKVHPPGITPGYPQYTLYASSNFDSALPRRFQVIYQPKYISPAPPAGYIRNIYFYAGTNGTPQYTSTLYGVQVKMGYTTRDSFKIIEKATHRYVRDTFITGLTTVLTTDSLYEDLRTNFRYWLKIPLSGKGFYFSGGQDRNLVVELSFGNTPWVRNVFSLIDSSSASANRTLAGYRDSVDVAIHRLSEFMVGSFPSLDFGFDLVPGPGTGTAVQEQAVSIGELYPNPASSLLNIPVRGFAGLVSVQITAADGKEMSTGQYLLGSAESTLSLRIKELPPGTYFVRIGAGDTVVKRAFTRL